MKKNSKAVERYPAETIGVDLGDRMSRYAILDEEGVVVEEGSLSVARIESRGIRTMFRDVTCRFRG
jgi:hypothetical protein